VAVTLAVSVLAAQQHTIEEVASGLRAPDPATRLRAVQILRNGGYPEAAGPLSAALSDPDDRVKLEAIAAERALFTSKPLARRKKIGFVIEVRSSNSGGEDVAAGKLALLPLRVPAEVLSGLAEAMRSSNPRVRLDALYAFGALAPLGGTAAEDALRSGMSWTLEALRRGNKIEQTAAAGVAGRAMEGCGTVMVTSPDPAGSLCAEVGNVLVDSINSRDPDVRRAAMAALGLLRYPNAAQALTDQFSYYQQGPDAEAALDGLAGIGHLTSVEIFKRAFTSPDAEIRRRAVEGLARAGSRDDLPDLERLAQTERANGVLLALHYGTLKLGAPVKPDQIVASLKDSALRPRALQYLLDLSASAAPAIAESLGNPDADTRMLVADVLGFSRDVSVLPALEAASKDADADVALAAKRAIDRIKLNAGGRAQR
jgi:HEAT repeat protein